LKTFWDATGQLWAKGAYHGKFAGIFVSTSVQGGGQESSTFGVMSTFIHHGIIFVPLGYKNNFAQLHTFSEIRGGGPYGAGTFSGADGQRDPSPLELELASIQGRTFYEVRVIASLTREQ
jgi:NAD(P)H dehydrogenase (quinone)